MTTSERQGDKKRAKEMEPAPTVVVNLPKKETDKVPMTNEGNMAWEIREQAKIGWVERQKPGTEGVSNTFDHKEYEKQFVLFALQRFVQALVGGVYVHSVPIASLCTG